MKCINFSTTEFHNIPKENNPAFGDEECLMLVKESNVNRICVLHIRPNSIDSVERLAIVWKKEIADIIVEHWEGK